MLFMLSLNYDWIVRLYTLCFMRDCLIQTLKEMIVLSNNDGCVISRSNEAKKSNKNEALLRLRG